MNFKSKTFNESEVMRSFAKIALEKRLVKASAKKEIDLKPTDDLGTNLLKLALGLRNKGLISQAELVESKIKAYLEASVSLQKTNIFQKVHPKGVDVFNSDLGKVETLDEIQDKFLALINKKASILDEAHPDGSVDLFGGNELGVVETLDDEHDKILKILNKRAAKNILNTVHPKGVQVFEGELGKVETLDEIQERFLKLIKKAQAPDIQSELKKNSEILKADSDKLQSAFKSFNTKYDELPDLRSRNMDTDFLDDISRIVVNSTKLSQDLISSTISSAKLIKDINNIINTINNIEYPADFSLDSKVIADEPLVGERNDEEALYIANIKNAINWRLSTIKSLVNNLGSHLKQTLPVLEAKLSRIKPDADRAVVNNVENSADIAYKNNTVLKDFINYTEQMAKLHQKKVNAISDTQYNELVAIMRNAKGFFKQEVSDTNAFNWVAGNKARFNQILGI
jgi:hypothetical protein